MTLSQLHVNWNYPTDVRVGVGRIQELPSICHSLGMHAPLLVTDPGLAKLPMIKTALVACQQAKLSIDVFSQIKSNPTGENVCAGVKMFHAGGRFWRW